MLITKKESYLRQLSKVRVTVCDTDVNKDSYPGAKASGKMLQRLSGVNEYLSLQIHDSTCRLRSMSFVSKK